MGDDAIAEEGRKRDELYREAGEKFGAALERLARACEADPEKRRDLTQDIHFQLWRSLETFDGRCSLRTWVYRVAHNVATSHVMRERRVLASLVGLEKLEEMPDRSTNFDYALSADRLAALIRRLRPMDRQVIVLYLEDLDAAGIGEITGLSAANVAMRISRIKRVLAKQFHEGGGYAG